MIDIIGLRMRYSVHNGCRCCCILGLTILWKVSVEVSSNLKFIHCLNIAGSKITLLILFRSNKAAKTTTARR